MVGIGIVGGISEGNYTSWTYQWRKVIVDKFIDEYAWALHIDDKYKTLSFSWWDQNFDARFGRYNLSDGSVIYESPNGSDYFYDAPNIMYHSANEIGAMYLYGVDGLARSLQSYLLLARIGDFGEKNRLEVWRDTGAARLWAHDVFDDFSDIVTDYINLFGGQISLLGEYIAVVVYVTLTAGGNARYIALYKGA